MLKIQKRHKRSLHEAIIDLYLDVKIRSKREVNFPQKLQIDDFQEEKFKTEKENLKSINPFVILEYIRTSIEIIMNMKLDNEKNQVESNSKASLEPPSEYESIIQKLEAEIRNHIRVEQQLKLYIESLQFKLDEEQTLVNNLTNNNKELEDKIIKLEENKEINNKKNSMIDKNITQFKKQLLILTKKRGSSKKKKVL